MKHSTTRITIFHRFMVVHNVHHHVYENYLTTLIQFTKLFHTLKL